MTYLLDERFLNEISSQHFSRFKKKPECYLNGIMCYVYFEIENIYPDNVFRKLIYFNKFVILFILAKLKYFFITMYCLFKILFELLKCTEHTEKSLWQYRL